MGRFNLRVRPVYSEADQLTGPEKFQQGIQGGLDWYAQRRETARTEGNEALSRGGERLPDAPIGGVRGRMRAGVGSLIRRIPGVGNMIDGPPTPPTLQPTGTFAPTRYPGEVRRRGDFMPDEEQGEVPGMPDPDDIVRSAIMRANRVVPPTQPVGALPTTQPRPSAGPAISASIAGLPGLDVPPERTFEYEGSDGARYRMPQVGERERTNKMIEYGSEAALKDRYDVLNDQRTAERERLHDERMKDIYAQRDETRGDQQLAHDQRVEAMRARLAKLTGAGQGNSPEALSIRRQMAEIARDRENRLGVQQGINAERAAAGIESSTAATEQRGVVTDPLDRRMLERNPRAKAANDAREMRVEQSLKRAREGANRVLNRAATREQAAKRIQELKRITTDPARIRQQMIDEGYPTRF